MGICIPIKLQQDRCNGHKDVSTQSLSPCIPETEIDSEERHENLLCVRF